MLNPAPCESGSRDGPGVVPSALARRAKMMMVTLHSLLRPGKRSAIDPRLQRQFLLDSRAASRARRTFSPTIATIPASSCMPREPAVDREE
jgi:hypothetical protein